MRQAVSIPFINLLIAAVLFCSCSQQILLQSNWEPENIDSKSFYSSAPSSYFLKEDALSLKVFNNKSYLNLIIETNNSASIEKIVRFGLSVWLDPEGKSRRVFGINFPLPMDNPSNYLFIEKYLSGQSSYIQRQKQFDAMFTKLELMNFTPGKTLVISPKDSDNIVWANIQSLPNIAFRYHLRLPFSTLYSNRATLPPGVRLSIGIASVNEATDEYLSSMSSREVISQKVGELKAGDITNEELLSKWVTFELAAPQ